MKRNTRKGFTGIELVIVIAIIAILAASLIPSFGGLFDSANKTADLQAVREMDAAIKLAALGKDLTPVEVIQILDEAGFEVANLTPVYKNSSFLWNEDEDCIMLVQNDKIVYPENLDNNGLTGPKTANLSDYLGCFVNEVATAEDLIANLEAGKGVKLTADLTIDKVIDIKGNTLIDLNGKTLTTDASVTRPFALNGSSLIIDANGATIECGKYGLVNIEGESSVTINNATITAQTDNGSFIKVRPGAVATVTLNNVNYTDSSDDGWILNAQYGTVCVNMNGGSYKATYGINADSNSVFENVNIETGSYAIYVSGQNVTIKNCTITTGNTTESTIPAMCVFTADGGSCTVTGCTLASDGVGAYGVANTGGSIVATGNTGLNTHWFTTSMDDGCTGTITVDGTVYTK